MAHVAHESGDLSGLIGKHLIYTYANGWQYEIYVKNATTIDYRIHGGMVGGRWVTGQEAFIVQLEDDVFKISWDEPTGTTVSVCLSPKKRRFHGVIFFPRWIAENPQKTVCYQNEHLDLMRRYRDAGPTYPKLVIDEFAEISFIENAGPDRDDVINRPPSELPPGYAQRRN